MKLRFQPPQKHHKHGWYVCTMGAGTKYLHSDMVLRESTANGTNYTGYYDTEQKAMDALVNYIRDHIGDNS